MSTGDQTQYIRGKLAQRGVSQGVKFMKDGFDLWAESTAPARAGEMEKEPAEVTNMEGGRMTLRMAKRFQHRGAAMCGGEMHGGALPKVVEDGINFGKQLIDIYKKVSAWIDDFQSDLQDEVIDNPKSAPQLVDVAKRLKTALSTMMSYKSIVDEIIKVTGAGKGGRRGGDLASSIATATEYAKKIINVVMWFRTYASSVKQILSLRSLNTDPGLGPEYVNLGKKLLSAIEPFLNLVSIGAGHCGCDSDSEEEMCGRAKPMTAKEMQDAVKRALAEPKEGKISSHVSALVEKAKKLEARRKRTTGGAWYDDVASAFSPQSYAGQIAERVPEPMFEMGSVPKAEMMMAAAGRRRPKRRGGADPYGTEYYDTIARIERGEAQRLKEAQYNIALYEENQQRMRDQGLAEEKERLRAMEEEFRANQAFIQANQAPSVGSRRPKRRGGADLYYPPTPAARATGGVLIRRRGGALPKYEPCDAGEVDDGLLCRKPIKCSKKFPYTCEGGEVRVKRMVGGATDGEMHSGLSSDTARRVGGKIACNTTMKKGMFGESYPSVDCKDDGTGGRRVGGRAPSARGAIVRKVMRERGLSLPQASKYVKDNGLY